MFTLNRKILDSYDNRLFPGYDGNNQIYYEIHRHETMTISVPGIVQRLEFEMSLDVI